MIIQSILDTDLYKFSMSYFYYVQFPNAEGTFTFIDRAKTEYTDSFIEDFKLELCNLHNLFLKDEEKEWCIKNIPYIPENYWEWLTYFRFDANKVNVFIDENKHLHIEVTDKLYKATFYEVPILAIVSELRNKMLGYSTTYDFYMDRLREKVQLSNKEHLLFSEFGTRRRFSTSVQDNVVSYLTQHADYFTGTSNVHFAMKYGVKPIGTSAHELCSFIASQYGYKHPNYILMEKWSEVYKGSLGIYLTDTFTTDTFLRDFTLAQAKLWDGVRHDSGDPFEYINKICRKYKQLGIDSREKTIIFSNALTMPDFEEIAFACTGRIKCAAGIGTNLTNDTGNPPANIVMKLTKARLNSSMEWDNCIKISDDLGKHTGDSEEFDLAVKTLKIKL